MIEMDHYIFSMFNQVGMVCFAEQVLVAVTLDGLGRGP